jgi:hypothetical protein
VATAAAFVLIGTGYRSHQAEQQRLLYHLAHVLKACVLIRDMRPTNNFDQNPRANMEPRRLRRRPRLRLLRDIR